MIQEKPVAGTVDAALAVLRPYRSAPTPQPLWLVAENYRFEGVFIEAAKVGSQARQWCFWISGNHSKHNNTGLKQLLRGHMSMGCVRETLMRKLQPSKRAIVAHT